MGKEDIGIPTVWMHSPAKTSVTYFVESDQCAVHTAFEVDIGNVFSQTDLTQPSHDSFVRPNDNVARRFVFGQAASEKEIIVHGVR